MDKALQEMSKLQNPVVNSQWTLVHCRQEEVVLYYYYYYL
jgi:hypothetical protein